MARFCDFAMVRSLLKVVLLAVLAVVAPVTSTDLVLKPLKNSSAAGQEDIAFILMQAPQILPTQYRPLVSELQKISYFPIWVGVPELKFDKSTIQDDLGAGIDRVLQAMTLEGFNYSSSNIFFAAHSPSSGASLQDYLLLNKTLTARVSGVVMLGSFLKRKYRGGGATYPIPTLTVGAELDGVCRISRIMEEYYHRIHLPSLSTNSSSRMVAVKTFPVIVVLGMSHMQFASGDPSQMVKEYDLKPESDENLAHQTVSLVVTNFIGTRLGNDSSFTFILENVVSAGNFFKPLMNAYELEGSYYFKPPCNENPPSPSCQVGSAWTEISMTALASLKNVTINDTDSFHPASEIFPAIHHPQIYGNCTAKPNSSCVLSLSSVSENIYHGDKLDSGLVPNSACEIRAKLKSRQSVMLASDFKNMDVNITDAGSWCMKLNQNAYDMAFRSMAGTTALTRYSKFGTRINMGDDNGCMHNGGLWIYLPMKYQYLPTPEGVLVLEINSIQLTTDVKYPIGMFEGMHYCKLLSPARVMEWLYVDGLRLSYSLSGKRADILRCGLL